MLPLLKKKTPETALFASGRSALYDRSSNSSALLRSYRAPTFLLAKPAAALLLLRIHWLLLKHTCRVNTAGCS